MTDTESLNRDPIEDGDKMTPSSVRQGQTEMRLGVYRRSRWPRHRHAYRPAMDDHLGRTSVSSDPLIAAIDRLLA